MGFALFIEAKRVFNEEDRVDIIENDGMRRFEDDERVEWVMDSMRRGTNDTSVVKSIRSDKILLSKHNIIFHN